jgi:hypothetical protein
VGNGLGNTSRVALGLLPTAALLALAAPAQAHGIAHESACGSTLAASRSLTEEQQIVLTVLLDRGHRGDEPGAVEDIAAGTAWPGARKFGVARTRRVLNELRRRDLARRAGRSSWEAQR